MNLKKRPVQQFKLSTWLHLLKEHKIRRLITFEPVLFPTGPILESRGMHAMLRKKSKT